MRKKYLRTIFTAAIFLTILLSSITVFGATKYKYKTIKTEPKKWVTVKQNKWTSGKNDSTETVNMYQINVKSSGYLTVNWKTKEGLSLRMFMSKGDYKNGDNLAYINENKSAKIAVDKGVYYFAVYWSSLKPTTIGKFRYTFTSVKPTANYSPGTVTTLAPGKKVTICMTPEYEYSRWYKIKLPKKSSITFWCEEWYNGEKTDDPGYDVTIYNSDFTTVDKEHAGSGSTKYFSSSYQDAGTYYIRVESSEYNLYHSLITLKWK